MADVVWQPSLLGEPDGLVSEPGPSVDRAFAGLTHVDLDDTAWYEHAAGWVAHPDAVFEAVLDAASWSQQTRRMYDSVVEQPRLTATWRRPGESGESGEPILPVIGAMRDALAEHYQRAFATGGLNLYRDGRDSVAWHGDRIAKEVVDPIVGIVSLGHPRTFRLRPKGGGRSLPIVLHSGDLLVTGGSCQRTWDHAVPKTKSAGPRISITFRHGVS
jgi:alkylated DNA repair dioxygenase AlkB